MPPVKRYDFLSWRFAKGISRHVPYGKASADSIRY